MDSIEKIILKYNQLKAVVRRQGYIATLLKLKSAPDLSDKIFEEINSNINIDELCELIEGLRGSGKFWERIRTLENYSLLSDKHFSRNRKLKKTAEDLLSKWNYRVDPDRFFQTLFTLNKLGLRPTQNTIDELFEYFLVGVSPDVEHLALLSKAGLKPSRKIDEYVEDMFGSLMSMDEEHKPEPEEIVELFERLGLRLKSKYIQDTLEHDIHISIDTSYASCHWEKRTPKLDLRAYAIFYELGYKIKLSKELYQLLIAKFNLKYKQKIAIYYEEYRESIESSEYKNVSDRYDDYYDSRGFYADARSHVQAAFIDDIENLAALHKLSRRKVKLDKKSLDIMYWSLIPALVRVDGASVIDRLVEITGIQPSKRIRNEIIEYYEELYH
ncbi:hypothetical protein DRJ17_03590 [Candidatus Woesearchaeota archaeon]|mgnify:CR=1 FL=1|nr:MAG: hypothetical protein DRJ17_03590 [Candidatus Woesearchaeota archaeon]